MSDTTPIETITEDFTSALVSKATYTPTLQTLVVTFNNGQDYVYHGVTEETFSEWQSADSKGKFFLQNIKGTYEFDKL